MKITFWIVSIFTSLIAVAAAQPGPGPVPDPWIVNGSSIYYNGCVLVPSSVSGGCKGNGTINATNLYVQGSAVSGVLASAPLVASSIVSGARTISLATDANFSVEGNALALATGGVAYPSTVSGGAKGAGTINAAGLYINGVAVSTSASNLTVGTSTISSGTTTRVLYDNAGVLGEYNVSGTGSVCMTTSCILTTPTLGAALATSINGLAITSAAGATLTITPTKTFAVSNSIALTGTDSTSFAFPSTSDTVATLAAVQTMANKTLTNPVVSGGVIGAITSFGIRSSGTGAFDLNLANVENLTLDRTLTITVNDANRTISLAGNAIFGGAVSTASTFTTAGAFAQAGAFATTITATGVTNSTLPAGTHTLAGLDVAQTWAAVQTFQNSSIKLLGSSTGGTTFTSANSGLTNYVLTIPAITGTLITTADTGTVSNTMLANSATTVNGQSCALGGSCTITATAASITVGATTVAGGTTARVLYDNGGVLGEYAVSGTGSVAMTTSPTFTTPNIGAATATSINDLTITSSTGTLTIGAAKTATFSNTLTLAGTDGSTLNVGAGGTLGSLAFLSAAPAGTLTGTTLAPNVVTSSLTTVGTIGTGVWQGSSVAVAYGGSGQTTAQAARGPSGFNIDEATSTGDANYTITASDRMVYHTALTAARTDTLPAANSVNAGQTFFITDFAGVASGTNTITLQRAGSDTINGVTSVIAINAQYGAGVFWSDGSSRWTYLPAGSGGSGTVTNVATGSGLSGGPITSTGTISMLGDPGSITNCTLTPSVSGNALTVALKTQAGSDPSSSSPCVVSFRNATNATGDYTYVNVTAATSFSTGTSGSTFGSSNAKAFRLWIVAINNGGTVVLGVINASTATQIYSINEDVVQSTTACNACTNASSAGVIYSTAAQTNKAIRILGFAEWGSGLTTAGTYATNATNVQLMGPGVKKPGDVIRTVYVQYSSVATGTNQIPTDNTIPQNTEGDEYMTGSITPTAAANILEVSANGYFANSGVVNIAMALFQDSTASALATASQWEGAVDRPILETIRFPVIANTTSSTTFKIRAGSGGAGTTTFNGSGGSALYGGTYNSFIKITEIMG